jgi:hypothetical protein
MTLRIRSNGGSRVAEVLHSLFRTLCVHTPLLRLGVFIWLGTRGKSHSSMLRIVVLGICIYNALLQVRYFPRQADHASHFCVSHVPVASFSAWLDYILKPHLLISTANSSIVLPDLISR